jgi:hypothetical protein
MNSFLRTGLLLGLTLSVQLVAAEKIGQRPYEMDWANRTQDDHPPLVDFENLQGWKVETKNAEAQFSASREQQIWGQYVGKLVYRRTTGTGQVRIMPPAPLAISGALDAVTLWLYGNNWGYARDASTPPVSAGVIFSDAAGKEMIVDLHVVNWKEWFVLHRRLTPEQLGIAKAGTKFKGILISNIKNDQDRVLYLDNLAVFTETFNPLTFEPRPERGIPMFPGQSPGLNTGPGKLPFPTRLETILPTNLTANFKTSVRADGVAWVFSYAGDDGTVEYRYTPKAGNWSDITAKFTSTRKGDPGEPAFQPCVDGGVRLWVNAQAVLPETALQVGTKAAGGIVESRWKLGVGSVTTEVTYSYRLWNKSLVIDVIAPGGNVGEVRFGKLGGVPVKQLVTNPFYLAQGGRPAVAVLGDSQHPLFCTGNADWYLSNGSLLWAVNSQDKDGAVYNGGSRYLAKTDGRRNDCFERFFITVTPNYEETLPTVANPASPWKHITGTRVWRAHGASNREQDTKRWIECHRYGMTEVIVTDHETGWRDGGESFTFRTRPAPGKGGEQGQYDYARLMQDKLGFVYGPYNNFTDFAPVNEYWQTDRVIRNPDNQLQHAWMRCYAPKPSRAVEFCAKLAPIIEEKFHFSTAYCDVHTCVAPWDREDYDVRVPGAGTFGATFYAYGEIMLLQRQAWKGPVYSEGAHHFFYCGLADGNYGQDQRYRLDINPWLVDFDLRKLHDLSCNFGMGNPGMFYGKEDFKAMSRTESDRWLDRFLAGTLAFGHPGFLVYEGGTENALRSYYMLQQLHSRYCLTNAVEIRYVARDGQLLSTSQAVAQEAHKRSQVLVRYADGTLVAANGNPNERLRTEAWGRKLDLPPNGYCGWSTKGDLEVLSSDADGQRSDYADTPAYLYVDGRGKFTRHPKAAGNGIGICRILPDGKFEIIPYGKTECGFAINALSAVALDRERKELGPATFRTARGLAYVQPLANAFSYLVTPGKTPVEQSLKCDRDLVVPGETVIVKGKSSHSVTIPADAKPGQRIWTNFEGQWIDFTVVPLVQVETALVDSTLTITLTSSLKDPQKFIITALGQSKTTQLLPNQPNAVTLNCPLPTEERSDPLRMEIKCGELHQIHMAARTVSRETVRLMLMPEIGNKGMGMRGQKETTELGTTGAQIVPHRSMESGNVTKDALFMHPPYKTGTGYAFATYSAIKLPAQPDAAFRAVVGKGDGSDSGDGILYRVLVIPENGTETVAVEKTITRHEWTPIEANLSRWKGQTIRLKLMADPGPKDNSSGDWGGWAEMRLESAEPQWQQSLTADYERFKRLPSPHPIAKVSLAELHKAKSGWLRYDG